MEHVFFIIFKACETIAVEADEAYEENA